ncbi:MAG: DUF1552 domain-containing protein [Myxococcales bacterium]|nr:DUF1552 domain-containing protein [Myxococcales bacterium]
MSTRWSRRRFLRGLVGGAAVTVGLPLFDALFDDNGELLAAEGKAPARFGTWFWGCGMNPQRWVPTKDGAGYDLPPELAMGLEGLSNKVSVLTGFDTPLNGRNNFPHYSPLMVTLTGDSPLSDHHIPRTTFDQEIAAVIGSESRFQSLDVHAEGWGQSWSAAGPGAPMPTMGSPLKFYQRVFGEGFQIGGGDFKPDPKVMVRKSVLSAVLEDSKRLKKELGSHDRHRLDQYFTAVRQLEKQLDLLLTEPPDLAACSKPGSTSKGKPNGLVTQVVANHKLLVDLMVLALACDQTRVFNITLWRGLSDVRYPGEQVGYHRLTHDEAVDAKLGYQPLSQRFIKQAMGAWRHLLTSLDGIQEGDGTLLDHVAVLAHSSTEFPKEHGTQNIPLMLAGSAAGKFKPGQHIRGKASPNSRVILTLQQAMGVPVSSWGVGDNETSSPVTALLA